MEFFKNRFFTVTEIKPNLFEYEIHGVEPTDQEVNEWIGIVEKILAERQRVASIYQMANMKFLKSDHRIMIGNWLKKESVNIRTKTIAVGYCTDSVLGKMVLSGIFLVQKPEFPYMTSTNKEDVLKWIDEQMQNEK